MALPGPAGADVVVPDLAAELLACLEALAELLDSADEFAPEDAVAAIAGVLELVPLLMQENDAAWDTLDALKAQAVAVSQASNRETRRALKRTAGGIVVPR